eukprot:XP_001704027.1 Hypothetical protein GL50803_38209 [Giardia lamblia ATCC 50803]
MLVACGSGHDGPQIALKPHLCGQEGKLVQLIMQAIVLILLRQR